MKVILKTWDRPLVEYILDEKVLQIGLQKGDRIIHLVEGKDNCEIDYVIAFKEVKLHEDTVIYYCSKD